MNDLIFALKQRWTSLPGLTACLASALMLMAGPLFATDWGLSTANPYRVETDLALDAVLNAATANNPTLQVDDDPDGGYKPINKTV